MHHDPPILQCLSSIRETAACNGWTGSSRPLYPSWRKKTKPVSVQPQTTEAIRTPIPMDPAVDHPDVKKSDCEHSAEYAPYPTLTPEDVVPPPQPAVAAYSRESNSTPAEPNPYVTPSPAPKSTNTMDTVRDVLGKFGKKVSEAAKKTEDIAGDVWQHLKTGPSVTDAAMGRISQISKVIAEGGYEKIFQQNFDILPEEKLKKSYACYLSTSAGPVMGVLYLSTAKLAFCSDNPLSYIVGDKTEWSYYKVAIPLNQLRSAQSVSSKANTGEKYIQIVSVDNHEFWFMGFVNFESAVKNLQEAVSSTH